MNTAQVPSKLIESVKGRKTVFIVTSIELFLFFFLLLFFRLRVTFIDDFRFLGHLYSQLFCYIVFCCLLFNLSLFIFRHLLCRILSMKLYNVLIVRFFFDKLQITRYTFQSFTFMYQSDVSVKMMFIPETHDALIALKILFV